VDRWDGLHQVVPTRGDCPRKKLSSGNCSRHAPSPNRFLEEQGRIKNQTLNLSVCHSVRARRVDSGYFMAALGGAEVDGNRAEAATPVADVA